MDSVQLTKGSPARRTSPLKMTDHMGCNKEKCSRGRPIEEDWVNLCRWNKFGISLETVLCNNFYKKSVPHLCHHHLQLKKQNWTENTWEHWPMEPKMT